MKNFIIAYVLLVPTMWVPAVEAEDGVPVYVSTECSSDPLGQRLAFKVREGLRRSASMSNVDKYEDSVIQLSIVCSNPEPNERSLVTRYSYEISTLNPSSYYDFHVMHGIGECGTSRVAECAENVLVDLDGAITAVREKIKSGDHLSPPKE